MDMSNQNGTVANAPSGAQGDSQTAAPTATASTQGQTVTQKDIDAIKSAHDRQMAQMQKQLQDERAARLAAENQAKETSFEAWRVTADPEEVKRAEAKRRQDAVARQQYEQRLKDWQLFTAEQAAASGYPDLAGLRQLENQGQVITKISDWKREKELATIKEQVRRELLAEQSAQANPQATEPAVRMPTETGAVPNRAAAANPAAQLDELTQLFAQRKISKKDYEAKSAALESQLLSGMR